MKLVSSHVWVLVREIGKDSKGKAAPLWDQNWHASLSVRFLWPESHMTTPTTRAAWLLLLTMSLATVHYNGRKEEWILSDS